MQRSVRRFFILEVILIEVRINKEVRDYQESLFFGLSLRQLLFALLAVIVAVAVYFGLRNTVGSGEIGWICVLAAFPFALGGFFTYNGMTLERFILAFIRSEFLYPRRLVFKSENLCAKAFENSTIKEALPALCFAKRGRSWKHGALLTKQWLSPGSKSRPAVKSCTRALAGGHGPMRSFVCWLPEDIHGARVTALIKLSLPD